MYLKLEELYLEFQEVGGGWQNLLLSGTSGEGKISHFAVSLRDPAVLCIDQQYDLSALDQGKCLCESVSSIFSINWFIGPTGKHTALVHKKGLEGNHSINSVCDLNSSFNLA